MAKTHDEWHDEVYEWLQGRDIVELEVREPEELGGTLYSIWALDSKRSARWVCLQEFQGRVLVLRKREELAQELALPAAQMGIWNWAQYSTAQAVT